MQDITRKHWIDLTKALCMLGVYLKHSQVYSGSSDYGFFVNPFYVNAFFFLNGYLFFRRTQEMTKPAILTYFNMGGVKYLTNLLFRLIIPTILFATLIYVPKTLFHVGGVSLPDYFFNVWGGISYWFTSALVVAQLVLFLLVCTFRQRSIWLYLVLTFMISAFGLSMSRCSNDATAFFPWFYKTGLAYTFIMALGGLYARYEELIDLLLYKGWIVVAAVTYVVFVVLDGIDPDFELDMMGLSASLNLWGFICLMAGITLIVVVAKRMRAIRWLEYIGKNSIVFYFFSGVFPAVFGWIVQRIMSNTGYTKAIITTIFSTLLAYLITCLLNKYAPFVIDLRKLKHEK